MNSDHPRWMDPDTHFRLERSGTPVDVDGFKIGEFTGHVICEECSRTADHIEAIRHAEGCPNAE